MNNLPRELNNKVYQYLDCQSQSAFLRTSKMSYSKIDGKKPFSKIWELYVSAINEFNKGRVEAKKILEKENFTVQLLAHCGVGFALTTGLSLVLTTNFDVLSGLIGFIAGQYFTMGEFIPNKDKARGLVIDNLCRLEFLDKDYKVNGFEGAKKVAAVFGLSATALATTTNAYIMSAAIGSLGGADVSILMTSDLLGQHALVQKAFDYSVGVMYASQDLLTSSWNKVAPKMFPW